MTHGAWSVALTAVETAGGASGVVAYLTFRLRKREVREAGAKTMVDTAASLTETALALLEPVRTAAAQAEEQVKALRMRVSELETAVISLTDALSDVTTRAAKDHEAMVRELSAVTAERDVLRTRLAGAGPVPTP